MSDSVRPHRWQPTRLPRPWDSPGKNTGVGCHFLLQCRKVKSESELAQSRLTPSDPMDCSLPVSSVQGIFQARALELGEAQLCLKEYQWQPVTKCVPASGIAAALYMVIHYWNVSMEPQLYVSHCAKYSIVLSSVLKTLKGGCYSSYFLIQGDWGQASWITCISPCSKHWQWFEPKSDSKSSLSHEPTLQMKSGRWGSDEGLSWPMRLPQIGPEFPHPVVQDYRIPIVSIVALQCCVNFDCTAKWISHTCTYYCCCSVAKSCQIFIYHLLFGFSFHSGHPFVSDSLQPHGL